MPELTLIELLYGKGAHANPLACVEDLSVELAGLHAENLPHSVWQIVWHLDFWTDYELRRIRGEEPHYPDHAAESWPSSIAPPSGVATRTKIRNPLPPSVSPNNLSSS